MKGSRFHSEECDRASVQSKAANEAFFIQWPKACRSCNGWGYHYSTYDPSPSGVALGPGFMVDADPCSSCIEKGTCGRCGASDPSWTDDPFVCTSCGWKSDEGEGAPSDDYCCFGECKPENVEEARRLDRDAAEWRASQ